MIDIIDQCFFNFSIDDSDCHGSPQIALFPMLYSPKHLPCLESSHAKICPYPGYRMTLDVFTRSCQDFDEISDSFHWAAVLTSLLWCFERGSSCLVLTCQKVKVGYIQLDTEIVLKIQLKKKKTCASEARFCWFAVGQDPEFGQPVPPLQSGKR